MDIIDLQIIRQASFKIVGRIEIAALQKPAGQDAKPQLNLVKPGAMFGRKVEDMLMARITQEGPPLHTAAESVDHQGYLAPLGNHTADIETPVGVEVIHYPVVTVHDWQLLDNIGPMGGEIGTGARLAQIPHDLTRRHHKRGDQRPCTMPNILMLAFFRLARCHGLCGIFALRICIPVFSSLQMTKRPCAKKRRALRYKEQIRCALASKFGWWLFSQYTLR